MAIRRIILFAISVLFMNARVSSQPGNINFAVQTLGGYTTTGHVPFWLRSNQFGSIPLDGPSLSFIGAARRDYNLSKDRLFDWSVSIEGRANIGKGTNITLLEGYGKARLGIFEFMAGRSKQIMGLCDTTLTSGSWSVSGTNLGIPEMEISVPEFWTVPILGKLFAIKGNFLHGLMGETPMRRWFDGGDTVQVKTYLHQKSLYFRFGKPAWRLKFYGGFNHQVTWGNEPEFYTRDFELSQLQTYTYVISGKRYNNGFIESTRLGNHLGSIDIGLNYEFENLALFLYRQIFYDGGALANLANIQDGLNGFCLTNTNAKKGSFRWNKLLLEFLYTRNQAGEPWSPTYGSLYEGYFNHGEYVNGWSYKENKLGTPFISTIYEVKEGLPSGPDEFFINNRVIAFHFGFEGSINTMNFLLKASWSRNFGTYWTTNDEQSTGITNPGEYGIFGELQQFSTYFGVNRELRNGVNLGFIGAADIGKLYYNSFGLFCKASYSFN